jgi:hypothetical protein
MGFDEESVRTFAARNIDENLKGIEVSSDADEPAEEVVEAMLAYRTLETEEVELE